MMRSKAVVFAFLAMGCGGVPQPVSMGRSPQSAAEPDGGAQPTPRPAEAPAEGASRVVGKPPAAVEGAPQAVDRLPEADAIPNACASEAGGICTPPRPFVERLCQRARPEVALMMFRKGTPWTRAYLRGDIEAWYVSGRPSSPKQLKYAEEVLIVAQRLPSGTGVQMSGMSSYDVYRWDGSCVSLMTDEVSLKPPAAPDVAVIPWTRLDASTQSVLEKRGAIAFRNRMRLDACRGASGSSSDRCLLAREDLSRTVAAHVREGGEVPILTRLP